jgi:hypothetical protein
MIWFQPLFMPAATRFTSSQKKGPFSVCHKAPVTESMARPKLLRTP